MANSKKFRWAGHEFTETISSGARSVVLKIGDHEFAARSDFFLREEAAARILMEKLVQEQLAKHEAPKVSAVRVGSSL